MSYSTGRTMIEERYILLVEDSLKDAQQITASFAANGITNPVITVLDGAEGLDYLYCRGAYADRMTGNPILVLFSLGTFTEVDMAMLKQLKADPLLKAIPLIMLSSSREEINNKDNSDFRANAYLMKPFNMCEFKYAVNKLELFWILNRRGHSVNK